MTAAEKIDYGNWAHSYCGRLFREMLTMEISNCDNGVRALARKVGDYSETELRIWAVRKAAVQDLLDWFDDPESNPRMQQ